MMNLYHGPLKWVPLVLALIALIELMVRRRRGRPFSWAESLNSLVISFGQRIAGLIGAGLFAGIYALAWHYRWTTIPLNTAWGLGLLFVASEFVYYWEHRLSHECRWFWASHVVHHSPNYLNLSAAYRLSWTAPFTGQSLLFVPLVWVGFSPTGVFLMLAVNLLYQFWLHTDWIPAMPRFDAVFNSPANHRVHHAANLAYLDANYGGITILFDRLFGTWVPEREDEPCRFGLVKPQTSHNPLVIQFAEWRALIRDWRAAHSWGARFGLLWHPPGWRPDGNGETTADLRSAAKLGTIGNTPAHKVSRQMWLSQAIPKD